MTHKIRIEGVRLRFAAAHFATFGGDLEPLHGHNYSVTAEIEGRLTPDSWVIDFSDAKRIVRRICERLDHKFLLQASPLLSVAHSPGELHVTFADRRYVFPTSDVAVLPIDNTTAERLAEMFAQEIAGKLQESGVANVMSITVGVEEMPGQSGWFTLTIDNS
jgi:6-pyruvoyltetrahydropterin/6-carboxytetrahydropterin synthase